MRIFQIIGCIDADGVVRRHFAAVSMEGEALHPDVAKRAGFTLDEQARQWVRDLTPEAIQYETADLAWCVETIVFTTPLAVVDGVVEQSPDFPEDASLKAAWVLNGSKIVVDMPRARDLVRDALRKYRLPQLAALDIEYQRADEVGDIVAKRSVAEKKQALRDVTKSALIDNAKTPEALLAAFGALTA